MSTKLRVKKPPNLERETGEDNRKWGRKTSQLGKGEEKKTRGLRGDRRKNLSIWRGN